MAFIDYYNILQVPPFASTEAIKKAYRRLALQFHPDVSSAPDTAEKFALIKEAYDLLSNAKTRKAYHAQHFHNYAQTQPIVTAESIQQQCLQLANAVKHQNQYSIDFDLLNRQIGYCLQPLHLQILQQPTNDAATVQSCISLLLQCSQVLPFKYIEKIHKLLLQIADAPTIININSATKHQKTQYYIAKYRFVFAVVLAILFCWLFYVL